jgi:hypothetical protein
MNYDAEGGTFGYYNSSNMYNSVGYFNKEYYRFGVVFIYQNGTLSNVYNTLGLELTPKSGNGTFNIPKIYTEDNNVLIRTYITYDDNGWINAGQISNSKYLNAKGVCYIKDEDEKFNTIYGIQFNIDDDTIKHLRNELGIRGVFFVR